MSVSPHLTIASIEAIVTPRALPFLKSPGWSLEETIDEIEYSFEDGQSHVFEDGALGICIEVVNEAPFFDHARSVYGQVGGTVLIEFRESEIAEHLETWAEVSGRKTSIEIASGAFNKALYALWLALREGNEGINEHDDLTPIDAFRWSLAEDRARQSQAAKDYKKALALVAKRRLERLVVQIMPRSPDGRLLETSKLPCPDALEGLLRATSGSAKSESPVFLSYQFDDGLVLAFNELGTHVYRSLVPPDLRPHLPAPVLDLSGENFSVLAIRPRTAFFMQNETWLGRCFDNEWGYVSHPTRKAVDFQIEALAAGLERRERGELSIFVSLESSSSDIFRAPQKRLQGIELKNVRLDAPVVSARLSVQSVDLKGLPGLAVSQVTTASETESTEVAVSFGFINFQTRTLSLVRLRDIFKRRPGIDQGFGVVTEKDTQTIESLFQFAPSYSMTRIGTGPDAARDVYLDFISENRQDNLDMPPIVRLGAKPIIMVTLKGRWTIARALRAGDPNEVSENGLYVTGFSKPLASLFHALSGLGLIGTLGEEARVIATRRRDMRDFELKLLKHQGVLNLLIIEALHVRLNGVTSDGERVKDAKGIVKKLQARILALCGVTLAPGTEASISLDEFCTDKLQKRLVNFVRSILKLGLDEPTLVLTPDSIVELKDGIDDELRLILRCLEFAAVTSRGDIFHKKGLNLAEKFFPETSRFSVRHRHLLSRGLPDLNSTENDSMLLEMPFGEQAGGALRSVLDAFDGFEGLRFSLDGQLISSLTDEMFRSEWELKEHFNSDSGHSGRDDQNGQAIGLQTKALNWFELNPRFFLEGREISRGEAEGFLTKGLVEHDGRTYLIPRRLLPRLSRLAGFWERLQATGKSAARKGSSPGVFRLERSQVLEMLALRQSGVPMTGGPHWNEICLFYDSLHESTSIKIPTGVKARLKDYQVQGARRLYELFRLGLGGILADDMGLGKTLQALTFLEMLREEGALGPALIVVPTSLTYNWLSEAEKFVPGLPIQAFVSKEHDELRALFGDAKSPRVLVATYGLMTEYPEFFKSIPWTLIIFDEAQNLKNISAVRSVVAASIGARSKFCLTGTPLENHLGELFALVHLVVAGALGDDKAFKKEFVTAASVSKEQIDELKLKLKPLILRRTKSEILRELPEKQENRLMLDFEPKQKKLYRDIALSYNRQIHEQIVKNGEASCQLQMLTALLRLRQACSDPAALPGVTYKPTPPKIEMLVEAVAEVVDAGESALVFTQFLQTLERASASLKAAGVMVYEIYGGTPRVRREKILREFNEAKQGAVLLMTLKTGGVGLNLTKASYVFHLEPWWNPAVENQATDRAHRIGQTKSVQVYRYIMHESVEEKIEVLKGQKQRRFDALFSSSETSDLTAARPGAAGQGQDFTSARLSQKDFEFLLSTS